MAVLMYFYLTKFRSPYNPEHLSGQGFCENRQGEREAYFWTGKNSDDFLKYIKREIFEVAYLLTSCIMTFEVMEYGHLWTAEKKRLPFVQKAICILLNCERVVAILLKLRYLHKYLTFTKPERNHQLIVMFVAKAILNTVVILFWLYDVLVSTHEAEEYSVLVRFWLYFQVMTIAVEPFVLSIFLPWLKEDDDKSIDARNDKFTRAESAGEQELVTSVNVAEEDNIL